MCELESRYRATWRTLKQNIHLAMLALEPAVAVTSQSCDRC